MKFILFLSILIVIPFFTFSEEKGSRIAYVNFEQVLSKTNAGKTIEKKLKKEFENLRKNIQKREKELQDKQRKLQAEAGLLSDGEKGKRIQSLQRQAAEYQQIIEQKKRELEEYRGKLLFDIKKRLEPVAAKIAKKKSVDVVKRITEDTIWVNPKLDITKLVIKAYKRKYK